MGEIDAPPDLVVGVISDTHSLLRPEAVAALAGVSLIIHAGDVGRQSVLDGLRALAPVVAVRGNVDRDAWAAALPVTTVARAGQHLFYILHDLQTLDLNPVIAGFSAVISGHSHRPALDRRGGVWYINPGAAGPRRFSLPVTLVRLTISGPTLIPELIDLGIEG